MPQLTRVYLKTALVHFVLAMAAAIGEQVWPALPSMRLAFFHLLMVGWMTQLIFGVAFWMFPKESRERPRGSAWLGWATFWLLNTGRVLRVVGEPLMALRGAALLGWLLAASAVLQWLAAVLFVANIWRRVKER